MKIPLKNERELAAMRAAGRLVAETFAMIAEQIAPGITLKDLDRMTEEFIISHGARSLYKGYRGSQATHPPFPGVICASVNHEICHGIPDERVLEEGDIVGIDIGLQYRGYCGDACVTFPVGRVSGSAERLLKITQRCLEHGIRAARAGNHLYDIGAAIEDYADKHGVSVVREWGGHGIGKRLHEPPSVSHTRMPVRGPKLKPGMVFTIEPMVNLGRPEWRLLPDGWTVVTQDGSLSAQFEHTIAITRRGTEILTRL
ncbi:MAG: type I methionyl aminopeptidase [Caldilineae bacterium]|nr:MAG: type I methionyl aminopeptidase [Caldilineae bacterium]